MWSLRRRTSPTQEQQVLLLSVEGMHCASCGLTIDDAAEEVPGVARSTTSFKTAQIDILLADGADQDRVARDVMAAVEEAGYRAWVPDR